MSKKGDQAPKKSKRRRRCPRCGHLRHDVKIRPDAYMRDVGNDPGAEWVACNYCDYDRAMDI